uniref:WD repeat domain 1 n=1 Tax=Equus caballus TaxID=9796 RepID=A0A3Q2IAH1_HORSE
MPYEIKKVFASLPQVERGVSKIIGGDPKGNNFLYTNGKCVILRNIDNPAIADIYTEHAHQVVVAKYAPSGFYIASGGLVPSSCGTAALPWARSRDTTKSSTAWTSSKAGHTGWRRAAMITAPPSLRGHHSSSSLQLATTAALSIVCDSLLTGTDLRRPVLTARYTSMMGRRERKCVRWEEARLTTEAFMLLVGVLIAPICFLLLETKLLKFGTSM